MNGARGVGDNRRGYQPVPPRPSLEGLLACSWSARPDGWHRLVPDACIDVLWLSTGDIWMCGPEETAWFFQLPSGVVAAGVRFRPGVLPSLIGFHAHTVSNRRVRWRALVGDDNERALLRRLAAADCDTSRMLVLENEVATLAATGGCLDPLAEAVLLLATIAQRYELLYIIPTTMTEEEAGAVETRMSALIAKYGGTVESTKRLGKLRMAYAIDNHVHGYYVLTYFTADRASLATIDTNLRV